MSKVFTTKGLSISQYSSEVNVAVLSCICVISCIFIGCMLNTSKSDIKWNVSLETTYLMKSVIIVSIPIWWHNVALNIWNIYKYYEKITFTDVKGTILLLVIHLGIFLPIIVHQAVNSGQFGYELIRFVYKIQPILICYSLSVAIIRSKHAYRSLHTVSLSFLFFCYSCISGNDRSVTTTAIAAGCIYVIMGTNVIIQRIFQPNVTYERLLRPDEIIALVGVAIYVLGNFYHYYGGYNTQDVDFHLKCSSHIAIAFTLVICFLNVAQNSFINTNYDTLNELVVIEALSNELSKEKEKNTELLHQLLPPKIVSKLVTGEKILPEYFDETTIFFSDIEGFTKIAAAVDPHSVVDFLNKMYTVMDHVASLFKLYKVETIGDAYVIASGVPEAWSDHAMEIANFALVVREVISLVINPATNNPVRIRVGMNSGPVMCGIVGTKMPRYCLFGDSMNTASRMETTGLVDRIHISESTAVLLQSKYPNWFELELRDEIEVKGKGKMTTYWLLGYGDQHPLLNQQFISKTWNECAKLVRDLDACTSPIYSDFTAIAEAISANTSCDDLTSLEDAASTPEAKVTFKKKFVPTNKPSKPELDGSKKKPCVLLIDDSLVSIRVTKAKLIEDGNDVTVACNGHEALMKYRELIASNITVSLIILDDDMPIMNGRITALMLRNAGYNGNIIGLTGKISREFKQEVTYCLPKPLSIETLRKVIK